MAKPKNNSRFSGKRVDADKKRNEGRKKTIQTRTAGQFKDFRPGQRHKLMQSLRG